jgi:feruloyl esterase
MSPREPVAAANGPQGVLQARYGHQERFDFAKHPFSGAREEIQAVSKVLDVPADWSKFLRHGGKLILHGASNDYLVNPRNMMRLYEEATKKNGQATIRRAVRFYVTPQAPHSSEGFSLTTNKALPRYNDLLTALQEWVENDKAPAETLEETLKDAPPPYALKSTRPLCSYPTYARYKGTGDVDRMQSYSCAAPQASAGTR